MRRWQEGAWAAANVALGSIRAFPAMCQCARHVRYCFDSYQIGMRLHLQRRVQAVWKGVGMSTIVSGTLASAIVEYRSEQNRLPDRSRRSLGRLLALI
jgi:hypothetical protein